MSDKRLEGKVAIIFGGGQQPSVTNAWGNGRAMSVLFARHGAKVAVVDMFLDRAQDTLNCIKQEGGKAFAAQADVTNIADIDAVLAATVEKYGKVDILVNNVGIVDPQDAPITTITREAFEKVLTVNLTGMMLTCNRILPKMIEQESGCIINISSFAAIGRGKRPGIITYGLSKAGVNALTETIAASYASKGIRANTIMPGLMRTPIGIEPSRKATGKSPEQVIAERSAMVPLKGGMGDAWDTAYAALYLASDEAKFVTGVHLRVDGGWGVLVG